MRGANVEAETTQNKFNKKSDEDGGGMVRVEAENTKTDPGQPGQSLRKTKKYSA